jgi:hypothetical protein
MESHNICNDCGKDLVEKVNLCYTCLLKRERGISPDEKFRLKKVCGRKHSWIPVERQGTSISGGQCYNCNYLSLRAKADHCSSYPSCLTPVTTKEYSYIMYSCSKCSLHKEKHNNKWIYY